MRFPKLLALSAGLCAAAYSQELNDVRKDSTPAGFHSLRTAGILYHGGPVMGTTSTPNLYYIWYGDWSGNTGVQILTDLGQTIGGSAYFNTNTSYADSTGAHVVNAVHYAGSANDNYSQGKRLTDVTLAKVVAQAITGGSLPSDANGVYMVLTAADVAETSGFCRAYCGFHAHTSVNGVAIKYAFIGDPQTQCISTCGEQKNGPNGNAGADAMASILVHELDETITDPLGNAWYFRNGNESADACAWTFGQTYTATNGAKANVKLGARDFLIQENWVAPNGGCELSH